MRTHDSHAEAVGGQRLTKLGRIEHSFGRRLSLGKDRRNYPKHLGQGFEGPEVTPRGSAVSLQGREGVYRHGYLAEGHADVLAGDSLRPEQIGLVFHAAEPVRNMVGGS